MVSSTETSVGTLIKVSCPAGQKLQTGHTMTKTLCTRSGDWFPQVPDCVGKLDKFDVLLSTNFFYGQIECTYSTLVENTILTIGQSDNGNRLQTTFYQV